MTRVHWLRTTRKNWLEWRAESKTKPARYLENRIVFCADCETRRSLGYGSGALACSVCGSEHWMHLQSAKLPPPKPYDQSAVQGRRVEERSVERLTKEAFFAPTVSLI
ncbi:MAG: hypothetical protein L0387_03225 [Acidobacteria bacterium]|nr:hypothetical protein [Acidobacteriota bacterium]